MITIKAYRGRQKVLDDVYQLERPRCAGVTLAQIHRLVQAWRQQGCRVIVHYPPLRG